MSAFNLLTDHHQEIDGVLIDLQSEIVDAKEDTTDQQYEKVKRKIGSLFRVMEQHFYLEDKFIYPLISSIFKLQDRQSKEQKKHDELIELMSSLQLTVEKRELDKAEKILTQIRSVFSNHVYEEEQGIFRVIREKLTNQELFDLFMEIQEEMNEDL